MMPDTMYLLYLLQRLCQLIQINLRFPVSTDLTWSNSGFFNFTNIDMLDKIIHCCEGCAVHWKIFSNVPGLGSKIAPGWEPLA